MVRTVQTDKSFIVEIRLHLLNRPRGYIVQIKCLYYYYSGIFSLQFIDTTGVNRMLTRPAACIFKWTAVIKTYSPSPLISTLLKLPHWT